MTNQKTTVLFRGYPDQSVIALFPNEKGTHWDNDCLSYQHIGQHGTAHYNVVASQTRAASPEEYKDLYRELTSEPFNYDLEILKKYRYRKNLK